MEDSPHGNEAIFRHRVRHLAWHLFILPPRSSDNHVMSPYHPSGAARALAVLSERTTRFSTFKSRNLRRDTYPPNFLDHGIIVKMVRT